MDVMAGVQTWCVFSWSSLDHAILKLYNAMRFSKKRLNLAQNSATNPKCVRLYKFITILNNSNNNSRVTTIEAQIILIMIFWEIWFSYNNRFIKDILCC